MKEGEERITELEAANAVLTVERDGYKTKVDEAAQAKTKAEAQAAIKEAVDKAELPDAAKARLMETFKDDVSADRIADAIQAEVDYIAKLGEAGKVKGMGPSKSNPEKDTEELKEAFKGLRPEFTDGQIDVAVRG